MSPWDLDFQEAEDRQNPYEDREIFLTNAPNMATKSGVLEFMRRNVGVRTSYELNIVGKQSSCREAFSWGFDI